MSIGLPRKSHVTLLEALSWIAFGDHTNSEANWSNYDDARQKLLSALGSLLDKAQGGSVVLKGKFIEKKTVSGRPSNTQLIEPDTSRSSNTELIEPERFHDFQRFDQACNGLWRGEAPCLLWSPESVEGKQEYELITPAGLNDSHYRDIKVDTAALEKAFPVSAMHAVSTAKAEKDCEVGLEKQFLKALLPTNAKPSDRKRESMAHAAAELMQTNGILRSEAFRRVLHLAEEKFSDGSGILRAIRRSFDLMYDTHGMPIQIDQD
jgi:hypothetical protein